MTRSDRLGHVLEGKVVVVTGGTRGIGAAICRVFAEWGADVVTTFRTHPEEAERVGEYIRGLGRRFLAVETDIARTDMVDRLIEMAAAEMGSVDIVVANAATTYRAPLVEAPWDEVMRTLDVTLIGTMYTLRRGAQEMIRQGRGGRLIIISSIHAEVPFANSGPYNTAKAGLNHLCRTLARELAPHNITVNSIEPGWIDTEGERDRGGPAKEEAIKRIPLGRQGTTEEVAYLALYLASPVASYVTGSVFRIDGGMSLVH